MTTDELIRKVGDPNTLSRELQQAALDLQAMEAKWEDLLAEHGGQWVAVWRQEFLFAPTLEELISTARQRGWDVGTMVVDRLIEERRALLL